MKNLFVLILLTISFCAFTQNIKLTIAEKTGSITMMHKNDLIQNFAIGYDLTTDIKISTGLHSQLSLSINKDSYITMNQLSTIIIKNVVTPKKNENTVEIELISGYIVVLSRRIGNIKNNIDIKFDIGKVKFENAGGEIFLGTDKGVIIKVSHGKVKIEPKVKTIYSIGKNEMCGITKDGYIIENDVFIRQNITNIPNQITDIEKVSIFLEQISMPYTGESFTNDYYDNIHP